MRRAAWVAAPVLAAALALGALRMADDVTEEVDAAAGLALAMAELGRLSAPPAAGTDAGPATLDALLLLQRAQPLRHLQLQVHDAQGQLLLPPAPPAIEGGLGAWPRWLAPASQAAQVVQWPVPRPDGSAWTVRLTTSPEAERREALASLLESLALLAAAVCGLLLVMRWNLHRALAPLNRLVASISGIEAQDHRSVQALPPMPVQELETLAAALRHLGAALEEAEAGRRTLRQQVLTLQEDERARLARELHDEFGQRLTAMRVDATWLGKRLAALAHADAMAPAPGPTQTPVLAPDLDLALSPGLDPALDPSRRPALGAVSDAAPDRSAGPPAGRADHLAIVLAPLQPVVAGLAEQCGQIQRDIRGLLTRLQPFGPTTPGGAEPGQAPERLAALLQGLVQAWGGTGRAGLLDCQLSLQWLVRAGEPPQPWPMGPGQALLPQALALTVFRITQEALTNAARHAQAQQVRVVLVLHGPAVAGQALHLDWSVADDGRGLGEPLALLAQRGNGLAGLRERVWSQGSDLQVAPAQAGQALAPGLRLSATFHAQWLPGPEGGASPG